MSYGAVNVLIFLATVLLALWAARLPLGSPIPWLVGLLTVAIVTACSIVGLASTRWIVARARYQRALHERVEQVLTVVEDLSGIPRQLLSRGLHHEITGKSKLDGSVVLHMDPLPGVAEGMEFDVITAFKQQWGRVRVLTVAEDDVVLEVLDRINPEFWDEAEATMETDPTMPQGVRLKVTLRQEVENVVVALYEGGDDDV